MKNEKKYKNEPKEKKEWEILVQNRKRDMYYLRLF